MSLYSMDLRRVLRPERRVLRLQGHDASGLLADQCERVLHSKIELERRQRAVKTALAHGPNCYCGTTPAEDYAKALEGNGGQSFLRILSADPRSSRSSHETPRASNPARSSRLSRAAKASLIASSRPARS